MKVDGPAAIIRFLETNPLIGQRIRDVNEALPNTKGSRSRYGFHEIVAWVLGLGQARGLEPW